MTIEPIIEPVEDRVHRMKTVEQVFAEGHWITAEQINALQAEPPANKSRPASDWKRRARIFSVNDDGKEYYARYQFDALYQPLPIIEDILKAFGAVADPWVLAAWLHSRHRHREGRRQLLCLRSRPARVCGNERHGRRTRERDSRSHRLPHRRHARRWAARPGTHQPGRVHRTRRVSGEPATAAEHNR
jgi:hypothetical protein